MEQQKKQACLLFRTIVEAAKELNCEDALELLLTYADYALGDTDELETENKTIKLILKQVVPALNSAERRYEAAVQNGNKGKDFGSRGGRPRKGETKEQAYERRNPSKTPEQTPVNNYEKTPVKPLDVDVDVSVEEYVDIDKEKEISKEEYISKENNGYSYDEFSNKLKELCYRFIYKHRDYNYYLDEESFKNNYYDNVVRFQRFVNEELKSNISIEDCCLLILGYAVQVEI